VELSRELAKQVLSQLDAAVVRVAWLIVASKAVLLAWASSPCWKAHSRSASRTTWIQSLGYTERFQSSYRHSDGVVGDPETAFRLIGGSAQVRLAGYRLGNQRSTMLRGNPSLSGPLGEPETSKPRSTNFDTTLRAIRSP
jgi:hypothetical protein